MARRMKSTGALALRLIVGLALLSGARMGSAQGTWSVISLPQKLGEVLGPAAVAVDAAGNLYVADHSFTYRDNGRIQKRDTQGHWSIIATQGASALAVDTAGNLYVADYSNGGRIQKRDAQGSWSVIATNGDAPGQIDYGAGLAVDAADNLYVADYHVDFATGHYIGRIQKRDAQGNWSVVASYGYDPGQVSVPTALAVDTAGNLYVAEQYKEFPFAGFEGGVDRIQKRDAQGNWSVIATQSASALAVDGAGNLYVAEQYGRIQKRDAQGNWSVIATSGTAVGQVALSDWLPLSVLAADGAGNLYVADTFNNRVQMYTPHP